MSRCFLTISLVFTSLTPRCLCLSIGEPGFAEEILLRTSLNPSSVLPCHHVHQQSWRSKYNLFEVWVIFFELVEFGIDILCSSIHLSHYLKNHIRASCYHKLWDWSISPYCKIFLVVCIVFMVCIYRSLSTLTSSGIHWGGSLH